jgi:hypothetical protein
MFYKLFCSIIVVFLSCSTALGDSVRRVVTGLDDSNKAIVLFDSHGSESRLTLI